MLFCSPTWECWKARTLPTPRCMLGAFTFPLSFLPAAEGVLPESRLHLREAPVNTLITNPITRGNLLALGNYLLTEHTLKHPVLKALLGFKLFSCLFSTPLVNVVVPSLDIPKSLVFSEIKNAYKQVMSKYKYMDL